MYFGRIIWSFSKAGECKSDRPIPGAPATAEPLPAQFSTRRDLKPMKRGEQGDLALGLKPAESGPQLTPEEFIMALNFPKTTEDKAGFRALRRALSDAHVGRLVQASQDVLTLLSQEGIYMDDLAPDRARPEIWRRFAQGERGRSSGDAGRRARPVKPGTERPAYAQRSYLPRRGAPFPAPVRPHAGRL